MSISTVSQKVLLWYCCELTGGGHAQHGAAFEGTSPNFAFLSSYDPLLVQYAAQAEKYVFDDPDTSLIKLRQFIEVLAQQASAYSGLFSSPDETLNDLLDRLRTKGILSPDVAQLFHGCRSGDRLESLECNLKEWSRGGTVQP